MIYGEKIGWRAVEGGVQTITIESVMFKNCEADLFGHQIGMLSFMVIPNAIAPKLKLPVHSRVVGTNTRHPFCLRYSPIRGFRVVRNQ